MPSTAPSSVASPSRKRISWIPICKELRQHLDLRPEEVYAALTYFYDHFDAMVAELKASFAAIESKRPPQPFSRSELLQRKAAFGN